MTTPTLPVGEVLRLARNRAGMSAREASGKAGLSPSYVTKVENGELDPSLRAFSRLAFVLGMSQYEVFFCVVQEAFKVDPVDG